MSTLRAPNCSGFFWTPALMAIRVKELPECFRHVLSPDAKNRVFVKKRSCIQILDSTLPELIVQSSWFLHTDKYPGKK